MSHYHSGCITRHSVLICLISRPRFLLKNRWSQCWWWEPWSKVKGWILCHSRSWGKRIRFEFSQLEMFGSAWSAEHIEVGSSQWIWISFVSRVGRQTPLFVCLSKYETSPSGDIFSPIPLVHFLFGSHCRYPLSHPSSSRQLSVFLAFFLLFIPLLVCSVILC